MRSRYYCSRVLQRRVPASPHARPAFLRAPSTLIPSSLHYKHSLPISIQHPQFLQLRTMSSAPAKKEFLCILPDKPGAQAKRLEVRPSHLEGVKPLVAAGSVVAGGAMLESHPAEGETPSFKGSMMLVVAENEAAALKILENDIYTRTGVWDLENAQIIAFKSAVREQL